MVREKSFNTPCQEDVYKRVRTFLDELVDDHYDDAEHCDFYVKFGSTLLEISIAPYEEDNAVIEVLAYCVQNVEPTFELMQQLLQMNADVPLGAFSLVGRNVYFSHAFLGRKLQPEQFIASLNCVASLADDYDDHIVERFGGETALELLSGTARKRPSRKAASH